MSLLACRGVVITVSATPCARSDAKGSRRPHTVKALRITTAAVVFTVGSAVFPASATAQTTPTYTYNVSGAEVYATATLGRFVGTASGTGATGTWYAEVIHSPLGTKATITGGSLSMALNRAAPAYAVTGAFNGGYIKRIRDGANCTNQVYNVNGSLTNVSVSDVGSFHVTLTHHRRSILGRCVTYSATVNGTLQLGNTQP